MLPKHNAVAVFIKVFNDQEEQQDNKIENQMHADAFRQIKSDLTDIAHGLRERIGAKKDPGEGNQVECQKYAHNGMEPGESLQSDFFYDFFTQPFAGICEGLIYSE